MEAAPHPWPALGVLLMRDGLVSKDELEEILVEQRDKRQQRVSGRRLGEILINRGRVTPTQVAKLVAEQYELPFVDFDVEDIDLRVATIMSEEDARRFWAIPISRGGDGAFLLAIADPATVLFSDELRRLLGSVPRFAVVGPDAIERAIDFVYNQPLPSFPVAPAPSETADDLIVVPSGEDGAAPADGEPAAPDTAVRSQPWPALGALLLRDELVTDDDLDTALAQQRLAPSLRLGEILIGKGLVTRSAIARLVAEQYELPFFELERVEIDPGVARRLQETVAWGLTAVPIAQHDDGSLDVAIADPTSAAYSDALQQALGVPLRFVVASPDEIEVVLYRVHAPDPATEIVEAAVTVEVESMADPELVVLGDEHVADVADEMPSVAFVLDTFAEPWEDEPAVAEGGAESEHAEGSTDDEEPAWTSRLALVDEVVEDDEPEARDVDVYDLAWPPTAEIPTAAEPEQEAEVVELAWPSATEIVDEDDEPDVEYDIEPRVVELPEAVVVELVQPEEVETPEHDVFELAWPPVDDAETVAERSFEDELEPQGTVDDALDAVRYDILGVGSQPATETAEGPTAEPAENDLEPQAAEVAEVVEEETAPAIVPAPVVYFPPLVEFVVDEAAPEHESEPEAELVPEVAVELVQAGGLGTSFDEALAAGASTIHFSPSGDVLSVRARVDGVVRDLGTASPAERDDLVERLEAQGLVRTHVVATSRGDKTTLFVRERTGAPTTIEELGLEPEQTTTLRAALERPSGAILVCGPAGSGTTTTLYAALDAFATPDRIVTTIEQPVERLLDGVDQIEVGPAHSATFAHALRELRFADTDVVMVGELADREAAELALQAAYEGRLVAAGFRAPVSAAAILRLAGMGIEPATIAASLGCIVSQRLVRTVCTDCRETYYASEEELSALGQPENGSPRLLVRGTGCASCDGTGFRGRTGVFEVMPVTDEIRDLVADGASTKKLQKTAVASGMRTLREEAIRLCLEGVTTVTEVTRALGDDF